MLRMKNYTRNSYASGSTRRKVFEIANHCGKYSPRLIAKRRQLRRDQERMNQNEC